MAKKAKKWGFAWKTLGAGALAIAGYYIVDDQLHPRVKKEVVQDLLLKGNDVKNRKERVVVLGGCTSSK